MTHFRPGFLRALLVLIASGITPAALSKTPGTTYCYNDICHRVRTIAETAAELGKPVDLLASFYDVPWRDPFNPSLTTSSGELFRADADETAASPLYPDGTRLLIFRPETGAAAVVRVNDAGPYYTDRLLDVSRGVAERLGFEKSGLSRVTTMVLSAPTPEEAEYREGRRYGPVPGYIGAFPSLNAAFAAWTIRPEARDAAAPAKIGPAPAAEPGPGRTVVIGTTRKPGTKTAKTDAANRVVLKPVKLRRPQLLAILARRQTKVADASEAQKKASAAGDTRRGKASDDDQPKKSKPARRSQSSEQD